MIQDDPSFGGGFRPPASLAMSVSSISSQSLPHGGAKQGTANGAEDVDAANFGCVWRHAEVVPGGD